MLPSIQRRRRAQRVPGVGLPAQPRDDARRLAGAARPLLPDHRPAGDRLGTFPAVLLLLFTAQVMRNSAMQGACLPQHGSGRGFMSKPREAPQPAALALRGSLALKLWRCLPCRAWWGRCPGWPWAS